jgi:hypothetical protein
VTKKGIMEDQQRPRSSLHFRDSFASLHLFIYLSVFLFMVPVNFFIVVYVYFVEHGNVQVQISILSSR